MLRKLMTVAGIAAVLVTGSAGAAAANTHMGDLGPYFPGLNDPNGVWCVQRMLNYMDHAGLQEDSSYGPATTAAVKVFQKAHGLDRDGIVGKKTGTKLLDVWQNVYHQGNGWGGYCEEHVPTSHD